MAILKNHVVAGEVLAAQAVTLSEAKTIGGGTLPLRVGGQDAARGHRDGDRQRISRPRTA